VDKYYNEFRETGKRLGAINYVVEKFEESGRCISKSYVTYCRSIANLLRASGKYEEAIDNHWGTKEIMRLKEQVSDHKIVMTYPQFAVEDIKELVTHEIEEELMQC
jgi:hypothetical protein